MTEVRLGKDSKGKQGNFKNRNLKKEMENILLKLHSTQTGNIKLVVIRDSHTNRGNIGSISLVGVHTKRNMLLFQPHCPSNFS